MVRRTTLFLAAALASSGALAEEPPPASGRPLAQGTISHGDSSGFVEDFFGGSVQGTPADQPGGTHKRDPAVRWDVPSATKR